jgi:hypothetical protein
MAAPKIDMQKLRDALPKRATLTIHRSDKNTKTNLTLDISIPLPALDEDEYEMVRGWHTDIIKERYITGFFVSEKGKKWHIELVPGDYEFYNTTETDKNNLFKK